MTSGLQRLQGGGAGGAGQPVVTAPRRRWMTRVLLPVGLLVIVVVLLLITAAGALLPAEPVRVVPVVVRSVAGAAGAVTVQAPGWLEPDPHPHYVSALAEGVVSEVLVLAGEPVEADEVVARLVDDDARIGLRRAAAALEEKRGDVLAARADLDAARLDLEHLVARSRAVAVSEAGVAVVRSSIEQLRAEIAVEEAQLGELRDEHDRKSQLVESGAVSEAVVARLLLRVRAQQATVEAQRARIDVLDARQREAEAEHRAAEQDRVLLIDERRAVALGEAALVRAEAAVGRAEADRDDAALRLSRMEVRSPVAGIVMRRLATPGSKLMHGGGEHSAHVVHLYDPEHMQVRVDVPLADAAHVVAGQEAEVTVEVLPDRIFAGSVTRIVHEADIQKNTVEVKVAIDTSSAELKPEMLARVRFLAETPTAGGAIRQRVFAPERLVRRDGERTTSLVVADLVDDRGRVERRDVVTGVLVLDGWIEIEGGLRPGDLLIADPAPGLEAGDRIEVVGERTEPTTRGAS
ncbi:MAG: HlyD family efflux transporter periplasmic adaptor subunit [Planctomycetes bacterium]|nr:HlyD family efflux transporter periplasmic adaptor subunit [Planctomycetota bacterium]